MKLEELHRQAWDYFQLHATQRLTTFNFYIGISSLLVGGLAATGKIDLNIPFLGGFISVLLILFSLVFWKLDQRSKDLIERAERALIFFENQCALSNIDEKPHDAKVFTREQSDTQKWRKERKFFDWRNQYTFSECFCGVFWIFGGLGVVGLVLTVILNLP